MKTFHSPRTQHFGGRFPGRARWANGCKPSAINLRVAAAFNWITTRSTLRRDGPVTR